ncbi:unnamed protein product [Camellia sinensis]
MDQKVLQSETQNNHKPNNSFVMDCGSSLNDSFELKSIERQLHSAISSRILSIPRLSDHHYLPPQQPPQPISRKSSKFSYSFHKLLRSIFSPKQAKAGSQDLFFAVFDGSGSLLTILEVPASGGGGGISSECKSMAVAVVIRKSAFEQFTPTTSNSISSTIVVEPSSNEINILASVSSQPSLTPITPPLEDSAGKENHESLLQPQYANKTKKAGMKAKQQQQQNQSFEKELQEMQEKLQQLRIEKVQTEVLLKSREETLTMKEKELETRGKEREKLQMELKKLQKMKEFKPLMIKEKDSLKQKQPMSTFFMFANERRATLLAERKSVLEVMKITGEEWKNMIEKQKKPYKKIAKQNKEKYLEEMEAYKQRKEEESPNLKKEEDEMMKIHKQYALQLLKKNEKTNNIIENRQKKKKIADPNKPKKPASSFFLFSKEARKNLLEERPEINNSTLNGLISAKWKVNLVKTISKPGIKKQHEPRSQDGIGRVQQICNNGGGKQQQPTIVTSKLEY